MPLGEQQYSPREIGVPTESGNRSLYKTLSGSLRSFMNVIRYCLKADIACVIRYSQTYKSKDQAQLVPRFTKEEPSMLARDPQTTKRCQKVCMDTRNEAC